jgi:undecaprenyl-diphosphatase
LPNLLYSVIVGLVQGVSEWLPISSKTQVLFVSTILFGIPLNAAYSFGLFMEVGSLFSATFYFRKEILSLLRDRKMLAYLLVVTIVTGIEGVPLFLISDRLLAGAYNLGIPMMLLGVFLFADGIYIRYSRRRPRTGTLEGMSLKNYVVVGLAQGFAALPGVSRSGMTVSTLLFMGIDPKEAFKLSYLAYIPAAIGGIVTTILFSRSELTIALSYFDSTTISAAIVTSALVGIVAISALLRFARRNDVWKVTLILGGLAFGIGVLAAIGSI